MARRHFGGHTIAKQGIDRILGQQNARKTRAVAQRNQQLQHGLAVWPSQILGIDELLQFTRQRVVAVGLTGLEHAADGLELVA